MLALRPSSVLLALLALCSTLVACGPAPEDACEHVISLMEAELETKGVELPADKRAKSLETCVEGSIKSRKMNGAMEYKREASCVMAATSLDAVKLCSEQGSAS